MYTIKEASARSGVGIPLLRAWERRYGVVRPTRTASGYRLYDEDALRRLIVMRHLVDDGWAPQQAAARVRDAATDVLDDLVQRRVAAAPAPGEERSAQLVDRIIVAARHLDMAEIEDALDEALASMRFEAAWETVLVPALRRIGDAWERGDVSVAGEHATSETIGRRMATAFDAAGGADAERPILVGLPPGARHEFGALAFAIMARRAGLPIVYIGPDVPVESWLSAATERDARAVVLGVPRSGDAARAREVEAALMDARPTMRVVLGGVGARRASHATANVAASPAQAVDMLGGEA